MTGLVNTPGPGMFARESGADARESLQSRDISRHDHSMTPSGAPGAGPVGTLSAPSSEGA